jgi:hypothetical protein
LLTSWQATDVTSAPKSTRSNSRPDSRELSDSAGAGLQ